MAGTGKPTGPDAQRDWHSFRLQAAALAVIVGASFGLFAALQTGRAALAVVCFALVAVSLAVAMWVS